MRFFFDLVDASGDVPDAEGLELGTFDQMRVEAWRTLCGMAADERYRVERMELSLRVRDAQQRPVYRLSLSIKGNPLPH